jgi:hypothetical protein
MTTLETLSWAALALFAGYQLGCWRTRRRIEAEVRQYIKGP